MGLLIVDPNADFSASAIGHAGLWTSVTSGLQALHETRRNASKAANNAVAGGAIGSVIGAPTFSAASASMDQADAVIFGSKPASGGLTIAVLFKSKNQATDDDLVGSVPGISATQGAVWIHFLSRRVSVSAYTYAHPASPPLSAPSTVSAFKDLVAGDDGNWELFFVNLEDAVSLRLYRAKDATTVTTATARDFAFDGSVVFRTRSGGAAGAGLQDIAMFGHWNRVLTPTEMATIRTEMQTQFAALGITVQ